MTYTVEVLLKETDRVVSETIELGTATPDAWTDHDVARVLETMLQAVARAKDPDAGEPPVALRGLSWIVDSVDAGVMIAIEIPSGAVVAGPFVIDRQRLDAMVRRAIARSSAVSTGRRVVH